MPASKRTRSHSGPLLLLGLAAFLSTATAVLDAHDPGLSSLDVRIAGNEMSALLSLAAPDVELATPGKGNSAAAEIGALALNAIRVSVNDHPLVGEIDRAWMEDSAAFVKLVFPAARPSDATLTIASHIPARLARGHRQLLRISVGERTIAQKLLDAGAEPVTVTLGSTTESLSRAASRLFVHGVSHILSGYDHLVFLAGLLLASRHARELVTALTAFTAAHSITLAMAAAGAVHVPPAIVEPLIATSIAWIGIETLIRNRRPGVRWTIVFVFGLVHGFGFAGALADLARWSSAADIAVTLLAFNAGVEAGQITVAATFLPFVWIMRRRPEWEARLVPACSLLITIAGGYWLIERLS